MSRNQKATVLAGGFYLLGFLLFIWGAMLNPENRISGTIKKRPIDIPAWLQNEPEYKGKIQNAKVTGGWGGGRLILWVISAAMVGTGAALSAERQGELDEEQRLYEIEQAEKEAMKKQQASYNLSIDKAIKQRQGTARLAIVQDQLLEQIDEIRYENGWILPDAPKEAIAPPVLKNELPPLKSPAEYAAEIAAKVKEEIKASGEGGDKGGDKADVKTPDQVPGDRKKLFQDRGEKIARSLAALKMSILSAAPTGTGKTLSLYRYLGDLRALYPENECYVIAHKRDSFLGLYEAGRVTEFDDLNPEASLGFLDKVYDIMRTRLKKPEEERGEFERLPVRLILDDWFASFDVLKNYPEIWRIVKTKIGAIITKGREANVCLYIATQSFNLEALGVQDSNIRGNLAITCQGLVTEKLNDFGELVEQGNYESIQLLIDNKFIVASRQDRERLNAEMEELIALSRLHKVPAIFSAVGKPTLGLVPYYEKPIGGDNSKSTNVAILDRNDDIIPLATEDQKALRARLEGLLPPDSPNPDSAGDSGDNNAGINADNAINADFWENAQNNDRIGVSGDNAGINAGINADGINADNAEPKWSDYEVEDLEYLKHLPPENQLIKLIESLPDDYSLPNLVRSKLKVTTASNARRAKRAIVALIKKLNRFDLWQKMNLEKYDF